MKNLEHQYERRLIEASLDPLFTIEKDCKILDVNNATIEATDFTREELIGSNFCNYFTEPQKAKEACDLVFEKGFVIDFPLTIKDHKNTDVLFNGSVYRDSENNIIGAAIVGRDVTKQNKISKALVDANLIAVTATEKAQNEKEKAEKATQIALDSVKSKQQFLSNMSHEIRTPLNSILGFTKIVLKSNLDEKQREQVNAIKFSSDTLLALIDDILDLAKVDSGKMTYEKIQFNILTSIDALLHLFEVKCQEKHISLRKEIDKRIPEFLIGDPLRLHQIVLNLLSNAVKFTDKGSIVLSLKIIDESEEFVNLHFSVSDTGIGIEPSKFETIFANFQQANQTTSRLYGGIGLGLAITKQLIEGLGGTISVESILNQGSTFSFDLQLNKSVEVKETLVEPEIEDTDIVNIQVLVVEDVLLNQVLMRTWLGEFGFSCDMADNGKIAIEMMQKKSYDIILMDLQMPVMNGFETTAYIRNEMKSAIPIIALTADVTSVDLKVCIKSGMNDYISKPVNEVSLHSKIVAILDEIYNTNNFKELPSRQQYTDLNYLKKLTNSNLVVMEEIITLYLEQTPTLIAAMRESFNDKDYATLNSTIHKIIPSFSIVGINESFEKMAKKVHDYAYIQNQAEEIPNLILELENICQQACKELKLEVVKFKEVL